MPPNRIYRAALITGATSGIGAAFADVLPAETNLLLTGRRAERLHTASKRLAQGERRVDFYPADLTNGVERATILELADRARVDLFVCNAGAGFFGPFLSRGATEELDSVELNVVACVELLRGLLPGMLSRARRSGERAGLVVVTSRAALGPVPQLALYAASKAFQLRLAQALAKELKQEPVDVLALCPSYTDTEFFERSGAPRPSRAPMPAAQVARDALEALGNRATHVCGNRLQPLALLETLR